MDIVPYVRTCEHTYNIHLSLCLFTFDFLFKNANQIRPAKHCGTSSLPRAAPSPPSQAEEGRAADFHSSAFAAACKSRGLCLAGRGDLSPFSMTFTAGYQRCVDTFSSRLQHLDRGRWASSTSSPYYSYVHKREDGNTWGIKVRPGRQ